MLSAKQDMLLAKISLHCILNNYLKHLVQKRFHATYTAITYCYFKSTDDVE